MKPTLEQVEAELIVAGASGPPRPRPEFVDSLEERLVALARGEEIVVAERPVLRETPALARPRRVLVLAAAAAAVMAVVFAPAERGPREVHTVDGAPATASSSVAPPSSTPIPPVTTVPAPPGPPVPPPTAAPAPPTTAAPARPAPARPPARPSTRTPTRTPPSTAAPTTTAPPPPPAPEPAPVRPEATSPPTTVAKPAVERLALRCHPGTEAGGAPRVMCEWSGSNSPGFAGYRLMRKAGPDGAITKVFATPDRTVRYYADAAVQPGTVYTYLVEAKDGAGRVVGRSDPVSVPCCSG